MRSDALARRRLAGLVLVALGFLAIPMAARLQVDNRLERWMAGDREEAERYSEFRRMFGSDEFLMVALSGRDLFDPAALDQMVAVVDELERLPGVERVEGPPRIYRDIFGSEDPEALYDELTSTPFYKDLFISSDAENQGLLVSVVPSADPTSRRAIVEGVRAAVSPLEATGFEVRLVGSPILAATLDAVSRREALRTFPIAFLCSMAMLGWLLRSLRGMAIAAISGGLTVVLTLGLMAATGRSLSMVTSALPSLLWVLALSNCIHILQRYQHHRSTKEGDPALLFALAETTRPCTLAAVTTALGFGSLIAAKLVPVREVGLFAAVGILISLAVNLLVVPSLVSWLRLPRRPARVIGRTFHRPPRRPRLVLSAAAVAALLALATLPWIRVESNPLSFLPASSELARDYREVGERLTGFYTMEVVVQTPAVWWDPDIAARLDQIAAAIASRPEVSKVITPLDLLRKARQWDAGFAAEEFRLPATREEAAGLLERMGDDGRQAISRFADAGGRTVRLSAVINEMDEGKFLDVVRQTDSRVDSLPPGYGGWTTGMVLRLVEAQQGLVESQVRSLGVALLVVFLTIGAGLRSWRLTAISAVPNVVPLLAVFAMMAVLGLALDAATVMVASVALGIAVDNTVHLLAAYQREKISGGTIAARISNAMERVGPALVVTTATAAIGFFALCLSAFVPIRDFGLLAGASLLIGLVATVVLVPALLELVEAA